MTGREGRDDDVGVGIYFGKSFFFFVGHFDDLFIDESNIVDSDGIVCQQFVHFGRVVEDFGLTEAGTLSEFTCK